MINSSDIRVGMLLEVFHSKDIWLVLDIEHRDVRMITDKLVPYICIVYLCNNSQNTSLFPVIRGEKISWLKLISK